MSHLVGLRVVRGPDWKWGDQDGGEGYVGTVISTSELDGNKFDHRTVTVLWDSGMKSTYQSGPKGFSDLRVVNNSALGVKHPNIPCEDDSCWVQEIHGMRWQCTTCNINLCTNCFLKKEPHNVEHLQFKRFYDDRVTEPPIVSCWSTDGPDSRIELKGIFPGAAVSMGPEWPYGREEEMKIGLVVAAPKDEVSGRILIEWSLTKERTRHQRSGVDEDIIFSLKEPGFGGFYHPGAFTILDVSVPDETVARPAFTFGDRVQIDPALKTDEIWQKQADHGMKDYFGVDGTVQFMDGSSVSVEFHARDEDKAVSWRFNPTILKKLNKFSVHQVIRIRNDEQTIHSVENQFEESGIRQKLIGAIGRVTEVDEDDPSKLYIQFDEAGIYQWLLKTEPLPSGWMELFESAEPAVEEKLAEWIEKGLSFFFDAIDRGDLRTAKLVHMHHSIVADARNEVGRTALHVACIKGHKDVVEWLIDEVKVDVEKPSLTTGYLPIHYAVNNCWPDVLKLLIDKGVNLNKKTKLGYTALHYAVCRKFTECSRLLIDAGCDINIQNSDGYTPVHYALLHENSLSVQQMLPRLRVNFELKEEDGFNVFHFAVVLNDLKAIELLMGQDDIEGPLLEFMPDSQSTVLHYACTHNNQVAKLLVAKSKHRTLPDGSPLLAKLLEKKNEFGMTALAIACHLKDPTLIELLIYAGADCKVLDEQGNTAILLVASSPSEDKAPTKELCSSIFKIYQSLDKDLSFRAVENKTILSLILFLMSRGGCVNSLNTAGLKLSDILLPNRGYPENIIELLIQFMRKSEKEPFSGSDGCMGLAGCVQQPAFQLSCPHKKDIYKACSKCFLPTVEGFKCGCPEEEILPIPNSPSSTSYMACVRMKEERVEEAGEIIYSFKLNSIDETGGTYIEDQMGNTYWGCGIREDGGIGYRCTTPCLNGRNGRCTAIVRRYIKSNAHGGDTIQLESPHKHVVEKRKADSLNDQGEPAEPSAKRDRSSYNAVK